MIKLHHQMTISELSEISDIPVSTIKFYLREGLLPKSAKTGKTRAVYALKHLDRLKLIKKIKNEGNIPLKKIKEIIKMIDLSEEREKENSAGSNFDKKPDIINSTIPLFRKKGYDAITITDIVNAAGIGRATFYKYFENKKELFVECIQKILYNESMHLNAVSTENEKDILKVFNKHAATLARVNPLWQDMINMLRAAALNDPSEFSDKLDEAMHMKIDLYTRRLQNGIREGILRDVNHTVLAVMILGIQEYCSEFLMNGKSEKIENSKVFEEVKDIIFHGILKK